MKAATNRKKVNGKIAAFSCDFLEGGLPDKKDVTD